MKILCSDENCSTRNRPEAKTLNQNDLLIIGNTYRCPYCRNGTFLLVKED